MSNSVSPPAKPGVYLTANYVVGFEGEIPVQSETDVEAEDQAYDRLSHLGQITAVAFKEELREDLRH